MAEDAVVDRTSKKVRIRAHVGDDIIQRMVIKRNGVVINDWSPYTFTTTLKDFSDQSITPGWAFSTGADGNATLTLTDTQTSTMGEGEFFGSLAVEEAGESITRMSIVLELIPKEDPEG